MATSHLCFDHPKGKRWVPGTAASCEHHERNRKRPSVFRKTRGQRADADRASGTIGVDSGEGFIRDTSVSRNRPTR